MSYEKEKQVSIEAALVAARLCEQVRRELSPEAFEKRDGSPVTVADFVSQAVICRAIAASFPSDPVVAEEDAASLGEAGRARILEQVTAYLRRVAPDATPESAIAWIDRGKGDAGRRFWTLDPIDGTKGFLRGDQYAVAIALLEGDVVKVGVLACPVLPVKPEKPKGEKGLLLTAVRGQGASFYPLSGGNPSAIHVAGSEISANLPFVESFEGTHSDHSRQAAVGKAVGIKAPALRMDGQVKYASVARGEAVVYLRIPLRRSQDYRERIWDHSAGSILVEEAGGRVTDMNGLPLDFSQGRFLLKNQGIIASNGSIHEKVLDALRWGNGPV